MNREKFAEQVIDRVRTKFPLVKIGRANRPFAIRLNGKVASLENLYRIVLLKPEDVGHQIERWAVELLRADEGTPDMDADFEQVRSRVLPMILSRDDDEVRDSRLVSQVILPGVRVGYVIDGDRTIAYLPADTLGKWNMDMDQLHELAVQNLVDRSEQMNAHAAQDETGQVNLILFQALDGFDASRLLLPNLHERLRGYLGSPFAAAVPNRDILLCFRQDPATITGLQAQIQQDYRTIAHPVTDQILLVTADGLAPYGK
ncbi:MAG: DUF1444 family protein [Phycisphaerae bacterium]